MTPEDRITTLRSISDALALITTQIEEVRGESVTTARMRQMLYAALGNIAIVQFGMSFLINADAIELDQDIDEAHAEPASIVITALQTIASGNARLARSWLGVNEGDMNGRNLFQEVAFRALERVNMLPREDDRPTLPDVPQELCGITPDSRGPEPHVHGSDAVSIMKRRQRLEENRPSQRFERMTEAEQVWNDA